MYSSLPFLLLGPLLAQAVSTGNTSYPLPVHNITRLPNLSFENLAVRKNGQILTTIVYPNATIYQVDPLGILPPTLLYEIPGVTGCMGIAERETDIFYFASGTTVLQFPIKFFPDTYAISELDVRGVFVWPNGTLSKKPTVKHIASLPQAGLPNGVAFTRPHSDHLLLADSFRGLIWNVNVCDGTVGVTLNDTSTKGVPGATGPSITGVNGLKVHDGTMYWTVTGTSKVFKVRIEEDGTIAAGHEPQLIAANVTCDDLVIDHKGNAYIAGPEDVITRLTPDGEKQIIAGSFNSSSSSLLGPSAVRFGRLASDRWSLYVTTNGGLGERIPGTTGVSRIDLGEN